MLDASLKIDTSEPESLSVWIIPMKVLLQHCVLSFLLISELVFITVTFHEKVTMSLVLLLLHMAMLLKLILALQTQRLSITYPLKVSSCTVMNKNRFSDMICNFMLCFGFDTRTSQTG